MAIRCCEKIKKSQLLRISILLLEFPARWPVRPDPSFLGLETSSGRPVGQADDGSDSMETGSLASQPSLSGDLRPADQIDRNGLTQLILLRLRPSTLQTSPLAQAVAHCLKR